MPLYHSKTLRKMPPVTRKYAKLLVELDSIVKRGKNLIDRLQTIELESRALYKIHEKEEANEVGAEDLGELDRHMLASATKKVPS